MANDIGKSKTTRTIFYHLISGVNKSISFINKRTNYNLFYHEKMKI
jgi:hypothetical protein